MGCEGTDYHISDPKIQSVQPEVPEEEMFPLDSLHRYVPHENINVYSAHVRNGSLCH